ncbi:hypothetical protein WBK31_29850 [Nonomuraea sp. N2-4H]|uniref:hypothetical protein n=1 Tax=Nonomuraea sp. N2-4H TaxID=3128898 RepID=UPI00324895A6
MPTTSARSSRSRAMARRRSCSASVQRSWAANSSAAWRCWAAVMACSPNSPADGAASRRDALLSRQPMSAMKPRMIAVMITAAMTPPAVPPPMTPSTRSPMNWRMYRRMRSSSGSFS